MVVCEVSSSLSTALLRFSLSTFTAVEEPQTSSKGSGISWIPRFPEGKHPLPEQTKNTKSFIENNIRHDLFWKTRAGIKTAWRTGSGRRSGAANSVANTSICPVMRPIDVHLWRKTKLYINRVTVRYFWSWIIIISNSFGTYQNSYAAAFLFFDFVL